MRNILTVCVIARNEEAWLPQCLSSAADLGASLVVADTASSDRTAEVARAYTDRVVTIPWTKDFAAARNRALAEADTPWVLMLDADERLSSIDPQLVADILPKLDLDGVAVPVLFYGGPMLLQLMRRPRLFRREGARYVERIAEELRLPGSRWSLFPQPQLLEIHNHGHFVPGLARRSCLNHNLSLLDDALAEGADPQRRTQLLSQAAGGWLRMGSFPQAANAFRSAVQQAPADSALRTACSLGQLEALVGMERFEEAADHAVKLLEKHPELKVAWGRKAYALNKLGRHDEAREAVLSGLAAESFLTWMEAEDAGIAQALWYDLGLTLQQLGELPGAVYAFMKLKEEAPDWRGPVPIDRLVLRLLVESGAMGEADLLFRQLTARSPAAEPALLEDFTELGHPEFALDLLYPKQPTKVEVLQ
ncbi:MAG: glycosyltransferase [Thermaerobacter sp.]|nr:glycosyltransferase [Thermaerobacter sp.]